ncbi:MAG: Ig-like domain-containing protein [Candidatus Omnitrophica bacterium]|nr:Ig-like domain-containing protein [Candidatus Omnitrophota bacterium]
MRRLSAARCAILGIALWGTLALAICPYPLLSQEQTDPRSGPVQIDKPAEGQFIRGTVSIRIRTDSSEAIGQVMVSRDNSFLDSSDKAPYDVSWDTRLEADGPHTLTARLQTSDGRWSGSSEPVGVVVDNTPPEIRILSPEDKSVIAGKMELRADASDNFGVSEVRFFIGNVMVGSVSADPYAIRWDPASFPNTTHILKASAVDRAGNEAVSQSVRIKVSNPNNPPLLNPLPAVLEANEGETFSLSLSAYDPEGPRDPVTFKAQGLLPWMSFDEKKGELLGTAPFSLASMVEPEWTAQMTFRACDPQPLCSEPQIVTLRVFHVNRAPEISPLPRREVYEGEPLIFTIGSALDPDKDPLTYSARRLPPWLKFDPKTLTFSGTPGFDTASTDEPETDYPKVRVIVCDPEPLCAAAEFDVVVRDTNRPPELEKIGSQIAVEGTLLEFEVRAEDPDGDALAFSAAPLPEGASFIGDRDGTATFSWKTRLDQAGRYLVTFSVEETQGRLSDKEEVAIVLQETSLSISGFVHRSGSGEPVEGAVLSLERSGQVSKTATTDKDGFYLISGAAPGTYSVRVSYTPNYEFSSEGQSLAGLHFDPISRPITLTDSDQQKVNFTGIPYE